jgi:hypothetical protein
MHGTRVVMAGTDRAGTVSFTRVGFVTVRGEDGTTTSEWGPDLRVAEEDTRA